MGGDARRHEHARDAATGVRAGTRGPLHLADRIVGMCNEAFASMFGYVVKELEGRPLAPLYPSRLTSLRTHSAEMPRSKWDDIIG